MQYRSNFVSCDFDLEQPGTNYGSATLVYSDTANSGRVFPIPIVTVANGTGPTVLLCAGNHGDEDQGQLILRRLLNELDVDDVGGRIIFLPAMNYPAVRADTRTSPLDNGNLNRSFPGDATAGPTLAITRFITDAILPVTDYGIDLHSGGHGQSFVHTSFVATCPDIDLYRRTIAVADAFDAPYMYVKRGADSPTDFDGAGHAKNIPFISAELGGGTLRKIDLEIGMRGVKNVLAYAGVIGEQAPLAGDQPCVYLDAANGSGEIIAPFEGIIETQFDVGDIVAEGQTAGWLYSLDEIERAPVELTFSTPGVVVIKAVSTRVVQGTAICRTAKAATHDDVLALVK